MKWPWSSEERIPDETPRPPVSQPEPTPEVTPSDGTLRALAAQERATETLDEALARRPVVQRRAASIMAMNRENHFKDLIREALGAG